MFNNLEKKRLSQVYCDSEKLKESILETKPYKCGLFPHEIIMLYNVYHYNNFSESNKNFSAIYRYAYFLNCPEGLFNNLLSRKMIIELKDENIIEHLSVEKLLKLLKTINIKIPRTKKDMIKTIRENFSKKQIIKGFNESYYILSEKSIESLKETSIEIKKNLMSHNKTNIEISKFKDWEDIYFFLFEQYTNFGWNEIKTQIHNKFNRKLEKHIKMINTKELDMLYDTNNREYELCITNTKLKYCNLLNKNTINIHIDALKKDTFFNVIYINKNNISNNEILFGIESDNKYRLILYDLKNGKIDKQEYFEDDKWLYYGLNAICRDEKIKDIGEEYTKNQNKSDYMYYCISIKSEIAKIVLTKYIARFAIIEKLDKVLKDDYMQNYIIIAQKGEKINEIIIYMIINEIIDNIQIYGIDLYKINSLIGQKENEIIKNSYIIKKYYILLTKMGIEKKYDYIMNFINEWDDKNNLVKEIEKKLLINKYTYCNLKFFNNKGNDYGTKEEYNKIRRKIYRNNKKYQKEYSNIILSLTEEKEIKSRWKNEFELYLITKHFFNDCVFQYRDSWLDLQSLDIYIPKEKIAIEYQGKQHYEVVENFGGKERIRKAKKIR